MQQSFEHSGILLMDKPQGFTSHDVVAKLRGILKTRRIGHGGTLDPLATGVLPVFVGGATKAADFAASQDKEYAAGFVLGVATDTQDVTGRTMRQSDARVSRQQVQDAVQGFLGVQQQMPPMYSAIKIGGQKLYDLARQGKEIPRPTREITVHEIELTAFDENTQRGSFRVLCSKGTYVRTLVSDLGERLGTLAALNTLRRTRAGAYAESMCADFETVERAAAEGALGALLRPVDSLFMAYPAVQLTDEGLERAARGAVVFVRQTDGFPQEAGALCRAYAPDGRFVMLSQVRALDVGGLGLFVYKNFR